MFEIFLIAQWGKISTGLTCDLSTQAKVNVYQGGLTVRLPVLGWVQWLQQDAEAATLFVFRGRSYHSTAQHNEVRNRSWASAAVNDAVDIWGFTPHL